MAFPLPRPVSTGSRLAVIAPAGPFNEELFRLGIAWLGERYEVIYSDDIFDSCGYLAGTDERRLCELTGALLDPDIDAIVCVRGGFGTTRLLPDLDPGAVRKANKMIVGFSDITALHALWARAGVRSLHAPMVAALGKAAPALREQWVDTLENPGKYRHWCLEPLGFGGDESVAGILTGGNLAVLGSLIGTPYAPPLDDAILFIEDVGERPYRVDRMLTTMSQAGWFRRIRGLVIGSFTEGDPGPDGVSLDEVLAKHFEKADFPVLTGFPAGHIDENEPIPFGAKATIQGFALEVGGDSIDPERFT